MITYRAEANPQKKPEVPQICSLASKGWQIVLIGDNTTNLASMKLYIIGDIMTLGTKKSIHGVVTPAPRLEPMKGPIG